MKSDYSNEVFDAYERLYGKQVAWNFKHPNEYFYRSKRAIIEALISFPERKRNAIIDILKSARIQFKSESATELTQEMCKKIMLYASLFINSEMPQDFFPDLMARTLLDVASKTNKDSQQISV